MLVSKDEKCGYGPFHKIPRYFSLALCPEQVSVALSQSYLARATEQPHFTAARWRQWYYWSVQKYILLQSLLIWILKPSLLVSSSCSMFLDWNFRVWCDLFIFKCIYLYFLVGYLWFSCNDTTRKGSVTTELPCYKMTLAGLFYNNELTFFS